MKKITFVAIMLSFCAMIIISCSKEAGFMYIPPNIIGSYIKPNDMVLCYTPKQSLCVGDSIMMSFIPIDNKNRIYINGEKMSKSLIKAYEDTLPISAGKTMDSLMKAHNDLYWAESTKGRWWGYFINICSYKSFTFNITSSTDYDAAHPAGTSLNDIMSVHTTSPREHIESKYSEATHRTMWTDGINHIQVFHKQNIEEFNEKGENLLFPSFKLTFDIPPTHKAVHDITVTITLETGRVVSCTIPNITIEN